MQGTKDDVPPREKKENLDDQVSGNNAGYEKFPIVYLFKKSGQRLFEFLG